jgi:hypothetical protein
LSLVFNQKLNVVLQMKMVERHSKADSDLDSSLEKAVLVNTASEAAGANGTTKIKIF